MVRSQVLFVVFLVINILLGSVVLLTVVFLSIYEIATRMMILPSSSIISFICLNRDAFRIIQTQKKWRREISIKVLMCWRMCRIRMKWVSRNYNIHNISIGSFPKVFYWDQKISLVLAATPCYKCKVAIIPMPCTDIMGLSLNVLISHSYNKMNIITKSWLYLQLECNYSSWQLVFMVTSFIVEIWGLLLLMRNIAYW